MKGGSNQKLQMVNIGYHRQNVDISTRSAALDFVHRDVLLAAWDPPPAGVLGRSHTKWIEVCRSLCRWRDGVGVENV